MPRTIRRSFSIALGALATTALGGCYYGDVSGNGYASGGDCTSRYGSDYYDSDGYAYDDGYGYDCYDAADYGGGFAQIGFGGGWYDDYYYPGYGLWLFDRTNNRYPLRGQYLNYWGGRRAWWQHHGEHGNGNWTRPGGGDHDGRPGGWNRGDHKDGDHRGDGQHGTRPAGGPSGAAPAVPPTAGNPGRGPAAVRPRPTQPGENGGTRPRRDRPVPGIGTANPTPERPAGAQRPPRTWTAPPAGTAPRGPEAVRPPRQAPIGQPGGDHPRPTPQAAPSTPAVSSAPPAVRSESPPVARPAPRPAPSPRGNRPGRVREQ